MGNKLNIFLILVLIAMLINIYMEFLPVPSITYGILFIAMGALHYIFAKKDEYTKRRTIPSVIMAIIIIMVGGLLVGANLLTGSGLEIWLGNVGIMTGLIVAVLIVSLVFYYFDKTPGIDYSKERSF